MRFLSTSDAIDSPLARFLLNPSEFLTTVLAGAWYWITAAGPVVVLVAALAAVAQRWWSRRCYNAFHRRARVITVTVPPTVDPYGARTLWANLTGLHRPWWRRLVSGQPHLGFEYVFGQEGLHLRIWVPGAVPPGIVERAVEAAWPGARTHIAPATPPLPLTTSDERIHVTTGGTLRLARPDALPIRTDFPADPLRPLLGAGTDMDNHSQACLQILARPTSRWRVATARRAARRLRTGRSARLAGTVLDMVTPGARPTGRAAPHSQEAAEQRQRTTAIVNTEHGWQWDTLIRYAVTTTVPADSPRAVRQQAMDRVRGRAHAIASAMSVFTDHNRYQRHRLRHPLTALAQRRFRVGNLLTVAALAAVAHLPTDEAAPGVQRAGARALPPPPRVPSEGALIKPIGVADTGYPRPVGLQVSDANHHQWVLGPTGSGKSTFITGQVLHDVDHGRGAIVIDPKGDLITDVLTRLPEHAADKVVLFDADSRCRVPCLNPLEGEPHSAVDNVVSVFSRVFSTSWGPRTDDLLRAACLTLRAASDSPTLADIPGLITNPAGHGRLISAASKDPVLRNFWTWYTQLPDGQRGQITAPLLNKLRAVLLRPFVVRAIAAGPSTVDMRQVLDGGVLLCRIPKGSLGEDTSRLLGSLLVARVWQATMTRSRIPQRHRKPATLYIDEAQNFLNLAYGIEDLLAEARGYRLGLLLAHHNLGQLPRELKDGITANARTKILFTASAADARELARHTAPRLSDYDLTHLAAFHAAVVLMVNGEPAPTFTVATHPLPPAIRGRAKHIRRAAERHTWPLPTTPPAVAPSRPRSTTDPRRSA